MRFGKYLGFCAVFVTACTVASPSPPVARSPVTAVANITSSVRVLLTEYVARFAQTFPDQAEYEGLTLAHHDALPDNSPAALEAWHRREDAWVKALDTIDTEHLWGTPEWSVYGYLRNALDTSRATRVCREELWPAHQYGWQSSLIILLQQQPVGSVQSRADALARWRQLPRFLANEMGNLREGARLGYTVPRRNVELAAQQIAGLLATKREESPLWSPANRDPDAQFGADWQALVEQEALPAIERYAEFLKNEYAPQARTTLSISAIPNGDACYRAKLALHTTSEVDPAVVYRIGTERVAEREAEALNLARRVLSRNVANLREAQALLESDSRNHFTDSEAIIHFLNDALTRARDAAPHWFASIPRAPLTLSPFPEFEAKTHPDARYQPAPLDGSRSAQYWSDVTNVAEIRREYLQNTAFHEGIPGHHLQVGLEREMPQLERPIGSMSAFLEGWARYAESLADEMGLYSSDLDRLGAVSHLPTGLVVDPGIHSRDWSRERAIGYTLEKQIAFTPEAAAAYVDRIAVTPGQMVSYGFGELEIWRLRRQAERELGARFDIKAFHARVLEHGTITLPMLRAALTHWIAETKRCVDGTPCPAK